MGEARGKGFVVALSSFSLYYYHMLAFALHEVPTWRQMQISKIRWKFSASEPQIADAQRKQIVVRHRHALMETFGYRKLRGSSLGAHRCKKCPRHWPGTAEAAMGWCVRRGQLSPRLILYCDFSLTLPCLHFWWHGGVWATFVPLWLKELWGWHLGNSQNQHWAILSTDMSFFTDCPSGGFKVGRQLFLAPPNAPPTHTHTLSV